MKIFTGSFEGYDKSVPAVITVGSFDGLHRGHMEIIESVKEIAILNGYQSTVLTFSPHPRKVLQNVDDVKLLTTDSEKADIMEKAGIDNLVFLDFTKEFSLISYGEFLEKYIRDMFNGRIMVIGYDHKLGHAKEGYLERFNAVGDGLGISFYMVGEYRFDHGKVSSTVVRNLISGGRIEQANSILGRPYRLEISDFNGTLRVSDSLKQLPLAGFYNVISEGIQAKVEILQDGTVLKDECGSIGKSLLFISDRL